MHVGNFGAHSDWCSHISRSTAPISNINIYSGRRSGREFTIAFWRSFNQFRPCYRRIAKDGNLAKIAQERPWLHFTIIEVDYTI